mgnify:FL=1
MKIVFLIAACCSVLAVALICIFLFMNGVPAIFKIGPLKFLTGTMWKPGNNIFGILPMIVGSICVTGLAILMGVPVAILTSVFLSRYCPKKFYGICKSGINLMAGIPSIVYGFFGLVVIVPLMAQLTGKNGNTMLTASILLAVMILPTVVGVTESAITSVPESYYEASLGLGATHSQSVFFAVVPAAKSGILAGIVLGIGRDRRDDGSDYDCRKPASYAKRNHRRPSYHDSQYCTGDGICIRTSPGSADCNGCCAVCLYPADQFIGVYAEPEGTLW